MGQFSWLDCRTKEQILCYENRDVYVLVPSEFDKTYSRHIKEICYDGYGHFGGYDIYELVALWNRDTLNPDDPYRRSCVISNQAIIDFCLHRDDAYMKERYGKNYLREIGIAIACYDQDNERLKYPIKITHNENAVYEYCKPSQSDPNQGWLQGDVEDWW